MNPAGLHERGHGCDDGREAGQAAEGGDDLGCEAHEFPPGTWARAVPVPSTEATRAIHMGAVSDSMRP